MKSVRSPLRVTASIRSTSVRKTAETHPVDELKIDQSFIRRVTTHTGDAPIVTAILAMARSLKLRVVAEGVEMPEELAFLKAHQCDEAQRYYFSRPVPAEQFANLLRNWTVWPC